MSPSQKAVRLPRKSWEGERPPVYHDVRPDVFKGCYLLLYGAELFKLVRLRTQVFLNTNKKEPGKYREVPYRPPGTHISGPPLKYRRFNFKARPLFIILCPTLILIWPYYGPAEIYGPGKSVFTTYFRLTSQPFRDGPSGSPYSNWLSLKLLRFL